MSNKVNGLWAVNSSSVFMFFDSVNSPSVWRFEMKDGVESWRMIPGVKNAQAVRGVAAAYRADGGTWLDPNGSDYAQAVRIPALVCGSRPPLASYRPWHCAWACPASRRTRCGGRSARSPVTLAYRTGTLWPQAGGTVRRCLTITIWRAVVWMAGLAMDCRDS